MLIAAVAMATMVGWAPDDGPADLVARLGSPRFAEREAAAESLKRLGRPALPELRKARSASDPEIRLRASKVRDEIESARAPRADHGPARLPRPAALRGGRGDRPASRGLRVLRHRAVDPADERGSILVARATDHAGVPPSRCRSGNRSIGSAGRVGSAGSTPGIPPAPTSRSID